MINITVPNNNIPERKYILDIVFNTYFNLDYEIFLSDNGNNWEIDFNGKTITFEDHFFNKNLTPLEYLNKNNIPISVGYISNQFLLENDIPIIYGTSKLIINENHSILCGIDIFASIFFMLTRWEEYVVKDRDMHNRFSARDSLAFKSGFLDRPVVNEYIEMLKNMFSFLGFKHKNENKKLEVFLTHDIDILRKHDAKGELLKEIVGDILKRKKIKLFLFNLIDFFKVLLNKKNDPYDTFDFIIKMSNKFGFKSRFYFMPKGDSSFDNYYDLKKVQPIIDLIQRKGHVIGIHPVYNAYNDVKLFKKGIHEMKNIISLPVKEGREHFLRFEVPITWQIWEDNNLEVDSSMSYADEAGFRVGTANEFNVFNILSRKKLNLKERPLIAMDKTFISYLNCSDKEIEKKVFQLINICKKYNMPFTLLWHNSAFEFRGRFYYNLYEKILEELSK